MTSAFYQTVIIGAGAAGLLAASKIAARGQSVLLLDHAQKIGEKIRISGGGRCNFTNMETKPTHFISDNPHFCKSALARYTPRDFMKLVDQYKISYVEKDKGQLFCESTAGPIVHLLMTECQKTKVRIETGTTVHKISKDGDIFSCDTSCGNFTSSNLVIATGGLSIPKIGATSFGYDVAKQFGLSVVPPRPALVPLTFEQDVLDIAKDLTGVSVDPCEVSFGKIKFSGPLLFTHRGLSGPVILQISSYWTEGSAITINLLPSIDVKEMLQTARKSDPKKMLRTVLERHLPTRLADKMASLTGLDGQMANLSDKKIDQIVASLTKWTVIPSGTEGYRTAEVTAGGVDTKDLSSKTMEAKNVAGLYFIGEVVDVTGHLGGFNFQWAWSSAVTCADAISATAD